VSRSDDLTAVEKGAGMSDLEPIDSGSANVSLSVIVVSYKCLPLLKQCLDSLLREPGPEGREIIVVDNASADGTVDEMRLSYPNVRLIKNGDNVGFPAANNQALAIARASNILLLNPDTIVTEGAISTLVRCFNEAPKDKVIGLEVRNIDGTYQNSVHSSLPTALEFICEQIGLPKGGASSNAKRNEQQSSLTDQPRRVGWVSGAALAFTRTILETVGNFDERMFWAEDLDFCLRAQNAGFPVYFLPSARILHYSGESGKRNYRRMIYAQHSSRIEFARKHFGPTSELALRAAFLVMLPAKMGIRLLQMASPRRRNEHTQRLAGYWDAFAYCLIGRLVRTNKT
jgi:GT2 family glycosyltransferase